MTTLDWQAAQRTGARLTETLLAQMAPGGYWEGRLSTSALSTATAVVALHQADPKAHAGLVEAGLKWLSRNSNEDGGWGDTTRSFSNISTTALSWAAFAAREDDPRFAQTIAGAEAWLTRAAGGLEPARLSQAVLVRYAEDHTFSVPILTMLAICGRLGENGWKWVTPLPFELAAAPHQLFKWLQLPVVSYAMPALIAIGQVIFCKRGTRNPLTGLARALTKGRTLRVLSDLQPENGGFLEAVPLTSFVVMSLAHMGLCDHGVVRKGVQFIKDLIREDGGWPIDTHLATWCTSLSVHALDTHLPEAAASEVVAWLLAQQYRREHPFTHAAPGGWAWTPLPGGVPDADDTSGAVLALAKLDPARGREAARAGITWLVDLQNRDGGLPTFCKGWGRLPFDKSCADITAHGIAAIVSWRPLGLDETPWRDALRGMLSYLERQQRADGAWTPLWFGNQYELAEQNPVYGTARVILALAPCRQWMDPGEQALVTAMLTKARAWLTSQANESGSWGGSLGLPGSIEETALAVDALATAPLKGRERASVLAGIAWLVRKTREGRQTPAAPIGFYFANLWYYEELYPLIFAVGALRRAATVLPELGASYKKQEASCK